MRYLAAEIGPRGVRVAGIYTAAVRGTLTREKHRRGLRRSRVDPDIVTR